MLDRESPIALYYQIAVDMRQRIARGEWNLSQRIPSEIELSEEYSVSRMTLRQALAYLEKEGVLSRKRGLGTFVEQNPAATLNFPLSFTRQMQELGFSTSVELVRAALISEIQPEVSLILGLAEGEKIAYFERLFFANHQPVAIIKSMLPDHLCPGITEQALIDDSLSTTLGKSYRLYPAQFDQWLSTARLSDAEAELLALPNGSTSLGIKTISYTEDGTVIEYAQTYSIQEQLALHIHIAPAGDSYQTFFEYIIKTTE